MDPCRSLLECPIGTNVTFTEVLHKLGHKVISENIKKFLFMEIDCIL